MADRQTVGGRALTELSSGLVCGLEQTYKTKPYLKSSDDRSPMNFPLRCFAENSVCFKNSERLFLKPQCSASNDMDDTVKVP